MKLKQKIIHEALKLFSLKGFLSTSIHDILSAAGTSKGGFYNHFSSKEDLFFQVLDEANQIWRRRNFADLDDIPSPFHKAKKLLENYRDHYLKDAENFPGGCVFITFSIELGDQRPHLAKTVNEGFKGVKETLRVYLDEAQQTRELPEHVDTRVATEVLFSGMMGAAVVYGVDRSVKSIDNAMNALIEYLEKLRTEKGGGK